MTVVIPESVSAQGNVKALFVPAIEDPASGPTSAELEAATDIGRYLMPEWEGPSGEQNTGEDSRFYSTQTFTRLGRNTNSIAALSYTYKPQGDESGDANDAYDALAEGNIGFLVMGYGIDAANDLKAGDVVDIYPVECGVQNKATTGEDEFAPLTVNQTLAVTGTAFKDVELLGS